MSHLFPGLAEAFADHLTIWAVAFAAAVVLIERVAAPRKRGIKLLVGLAMAHTLAVIIVGVGVGVGVIDNHSKPVVIFSITHSIPCSASASSCL